MKTSLHFILLALALIMSPFTTCAALEITSPENIILGEIFNNFSNTNYFYFVNKGTKDINVLRLMPTCSCIKISTDITIVKPNEKLTVEMLFDAGTVDGKFSRGAWLVTDDPDNNRTLLRVSGEVLPLFKGFPDQILLLNAKDENTIFTNHFTFTATKTNYFLQPPYCDALTNNIAFDWKHRQSGSTNIWDLTTIINPTEKITKTFNINLPVKGPHEVTDRLIRMKIAVGVKLRANPAKLVATTLDAPFNKKILLYTNIPDSRVEKLSWEPRLPGIAVESSIYQTRSRFASARNRSNVSSSGSRTRFECVVSISPEALKELLKTKEPAIIFHYPDHQSVKIPIELYQK